LMRMLLMCFSTVPSWYPARPRSSDSPRIRDRRPAILLDQRGTSSRQRCPVRRQDTTRLRNLRSARHKEQGGAAARCRWRTRHRVLRWGARPARARRAAQQP
jgi:hypothetical protein